MPGGWTMSMMWMRMPAQTWPGAAASFVGMWIVMMVPMMLPTVAPVLWRHREAVTMTGAKRPGALTAVTGVGYFAVWAALGVALYHIGALAAAVVTHEHALVRAAPIVAGLIVLIAGAIQLTSWKTRRLACCRRGSRCEASHAAGVVGAWRDGVRLGLRCVACCANLMAIPLVVGTMDISTMVVVGAAIAAERAVPRGEWVARATGMVLVAAGAALICRSVAL